MTIENALTEELGTVARTVTTPPPPAVADLVREAERRTARTRRNVAIVSGLVAAAVVGAVLIGGTIGKPSAGPGPSHHPTSEVTTYYAAGTPYVVKDKLYIAHQQQPGEFDHVDNVGRFSLASRIPPQHGFLALRDGRPLTTGDDIDTSTSPMLSSTGLVAWFEVEQRTLYVAEKDLNTGRMLGRVSTGRTSQPGVVDYQLDAISDDGTVYYQLANERLPWRWTPGSAPRHHDPQVTSSGRPRGFPAGVYAYLSPDGLWGAWVTRTRPHAEVVIQRPGDASSTFTVKLEQPISTDFVFIDWSTPTVVRLRGDNNNLPAQSCDIVQRSCAVAPLP